MQHHSVQNVCGGHMDSQDLIKVSLLILQHDCIVQLLTVEFPSRLRLPLHIVFVLDVKANYYIKYREKIE